MALQLVPKIRKHTKFISEKLLTVKLLTVKSICACSGGRGGLDLGKNVVLS